MPGVPSGRACDACRQQKKKCDYGQPCCSRCSRLGIACIGAGERKFHFVDVKCFRRKEASKQITAHRVESSTSLSPFPSNDQDALINAFANTIKPSTSRRYNLTLAYGRFIDEVPKRLGHNEALDSAVRAVTCAHSDMCSHRRAGTDSLMKYNKAISSLRTSLDDPVEARSVETLCAVLVLLMCQALNGLDREHWFAHCKGAGQILRARGCHDPNDHFERKLYEALQGQMFISVIFSQDVGQDASVWRDFLQSSPDQPTDLMMICLSRIPEFLTRGQCEINDGIADLPLRGEVRTTYASILSVRSELRVLVTNARSLLTKGCPPTNAAEEASFVSQSAYNFVLSLCCIFNCMLQALNTGGDQIAVEAEEFANEALTLTHGAAKLRPLGAGPILVLLLVAWTCTSSVLKKSLIEHALEDHYRDFVRGPEKRVRLTTMLELLSRNLRFEDSEETATRRLVIHD